MSAVSEPSEAEAIHAGVYVRVSTSHQADDGLSLETQRQRLEAIAQEHGWSTTLYEDAGISGEKLEERRALMEMLDAALAGVIQVVLVYDESRLARNNYVAAHIAERLRHAGVRLHFANGESDLHDPQAEMMFTVTSAFATFDNKLRTAKTVAASARRPHADTGAADRRPMGTEPHRRRTALGTASSSSMRTRPRQSGSPPR